MRLALLHLENDPNVQQIIQFVTNQVLAEGLKRHYTEQYAHPTDAQIQDYYNQNSAKYREATLERIIIPNNPGLPTSPRTMKRKRRPRLKRSGSAGSPEKTQSSCSRLRSSQPVSRELPRQKSTLAPNARAVCR